MKESSSSIGWFLLKVLIGLAGVGLAIGFVSFQLQVGNITVIIGDKNKVENGDQSQTVVQPIKPVTAEAKPEQSPVQASPPPLEEPTSQPTTELPRSRARASYVRTARPQYESDEDCTCPIDEQASDPQAGQYVQPRFTTSSYPTYVSNPSPLVVPSYPQMEFHTHTTSVSVQNGGVTVRTVTSGQRSHTRIVVNGQVVVDE